MSSEKLREMLIRHEALRQDLYKCPAGYWTIGVGRNLQTNGISKKVALIMLEEDIQERMIYFSRIKWFILMDKVRQEAIIDMSFMGVGTLLTFKRMIAALEKQDYQSAAAEMLNSKWSQQVGDRSLELAHMMRTGEYRK